MNENRAIAVVIGPYVIGALLALVLALCSGCRTAAPGAPPAGTNDVFTRIGNLAELAAYTGTALHLADNPEDRPRFEGAIAALEGLAATNGFDPAGLALALQGLPIRELRDPKASIIIGTAVMLYEFELGRLTPIEQSAYVAVVAGRVRKGMQRALGPPAPPGLKTGLAEPQGEEGRRIWIESVRLRLWPVPAEEWIREYGRAGTNWAVTGVHAWPTHRVVIGFESEAGARYVVQSKHGDVNPVRVNGGRFGADQRVVWDGVGESEFAVGRDGGRDDGDAKCGGGEGVFPGD